jgi:hypothetical protein
MSGKTQRWTDNPLRLVAYVPVMAAGGVAVFYAVGAIAKVGEISGAGFNAATVLQSTPIQQLLALGVSAVVEPISLSGLAALAVLIALIAWMADRSASTTSERSITQVELLVLSRQVQTRERYRRSVEGVPPPVPTPSTIRRVARWTWRWAKRALLATGLLVLVLVAIVFELGGAPTTIASWLIVAPPAWFVAKRLGMRTRAAVATAFIVSAVVSMTTRALVYPLPLPRVMVRTDAGTVEGQLLITTENATTVGLANCKIETIPAAHIKSVLIEPEERVPIRSTGALLFGLHAKLDVRKYPGSCGGEVYR